MAFRSSSTFISEEQQAALRQPKKRQPRPNQKPPTNRASGHKRTVAQDARTTPAGGPNREWKRRQQQQRDSWDASREDNRQLATQFGAFHADKYRLLKLAAERSAAAGAVADAVLLHGCLSILEDEPALAADKQLLLASMQQQSESEQQQQTETASAGPQPQQAQFVKLVSQREVAVHTLGASFRLPVPTVQCACCSEQWEVSPAGAGFFGSSPEQPFAWYSQQLLDSYARLSTSGTSCSNMAAMLNHVNFMEAGLQVKIWQLSTAWTEWRKVAQPIYNAAGVAASLTGSTLGPAALCPGCAVVPEDPDTAATTSTGAGPARLHTALRYAAGDTELAVQAKRNGLLPGVVSTQQIGPSGKPVLPVACFDGNVKGNRYASAGKAASSGFEQQPHGLFFGEAHADVWQLQAAGEGLPLSSTGSSGLGGSSSSDSSHQPAADDGSLECHPRLTCARETSQCSSVSDVCGLVAGVCAHGQPLLKSALAMPAPERSLYYDLSLSHILKDADLRLMYLDTACRYAAHWGLHMPAGTGPGLFKVPWWHARGHGSVCFLKNSGLYLPGAGRRVGENCEHLWAELRPTFGLTRYMTTDKYISTLEDVLLQVSEDKMRSYVTFMERQARAAVKKLEKTTATISETARLAADMGFTRQQLLLASVMTLSSGGQTGVPDESPEEQRLRHLAEYVRCDEEETLLRTLQDRRSTVAVALPGTARQLQSQPEHAKRMSKLLDRMAKILVELQLDAAPAEDSAEYQQGLAALRDQQLRHLQQQVELEAAALGLATQERQQLGAASELTRSLDKRSQARRARIRQLVDTISAWQQRDLPSSPVTELLPQQWTEQDIKQLFSGMFPWQQTAGGAGPLPSQLVDRFRDACAEEARTIEELEYLRVERERTVQYFKHLSSCATAAAAELGDAHLTQSAAIQEQLEGAPEGCSMMAACGALKGELVQLSQTLAQQKLLEGWAATFESWRMQAVEAFKQLA